MVTLKQRRGHPLWWLAPYCAFLMAGYCVFLAVMVATKDHDLKVAAIIAGVALANLAACAFLVWAHRTGWGR